MLIEVTGVHGIPAVELSNGAKVDKPVHLYRFVEGPWSIGRDPAADLRNLL